MRSSTVRALLSSLVVVTPLLLSATPAMAAAAPIAVSHIQNAATPHCARLAGIDGAAPGQLNCFVSESAAIAQATGDPSYAQMTPAAAKAAVQLKAVSRRATGGGVHTNATPGQGGTVLLSTDYDAVNLGGNSLLWYGDRNCGGSVGRFFTANMGAGWNDRVRSTYSWTGTNCNHHILYENGNQNAQTPGNSLDCGLITPNHKWGGGGSLDAEVSSERWSA